uniref:Uncharacterized protein n=1 Tax=Zea mays TaxID=4577 RepID=C4IZA2_MAIZE|nr:unknown [Zea mays]
MICNFFRLNITRTYLVMVNTNNRYHTVFVPFFLPANLCCYLVFSISLSRKINIVSVAWFGAMPSLIILLKYLPASFSLPAFALILINVLKVTTSGFMPLLMICSNKQPASSTFPTFPN